MTTNKPEVFEVYRTKQGTLESVVLLADYKDLQAERDALAAHVERMEDIIERSTLADSPAAESALEDAPETSLARLKAQWQRDLVTQLAEGFRQAWPELPGKHAWILGAGDAICRQDGGGEA